MLARGHGEWHILLIAGPTASRMSFRCPRGPCRFIVALLAIDTLSRERFRGEIPFPCKVKSHALPNIVLSTVGQRGLPAGRALSLERPSGLRGWAWSQWPLHGYAPAFQSYSDSCKYLLVFTPIWGIIGITAQHEVVTYLTICSLCIGEYIRDALVTKLSKAKSFAVETNNIETDICNLPRRQPRYIGTP